MGLSQTIERDFVNTKNCYFALEKRKLRRGYLSLDESEQSGAVIDVIVHLYQFLKFEQFFVLNLVSKGVLTLCGLLTASLPSWLGA